MDELKSWLKLKGDAAAPALLSLLAPLGVSELALAEAIEADLASLRLDDLAAAMEREGVTAAEVGKRMNARKIAAEQAAQKQEEALTRE